jgi:hypothetical protein
LHINLVLLFETQLVKCERVGDVPSRPARVISEDTPYGTNYLGDLTVPRVGVDNVAKWKSGQVI